MNSRTTIKFLLVDDLEANLIALEALLRRDGLELLKARSGQEALELLLREEVALAFVDVHMPEMGGFELAEIMRSTERTRGVPIIFLTAAEMDHQRRIKGYETGAVDFLSKPIDAATLLTKAATFFELARQRADLLESEVRLRVANEKLARSNAELARADRMKDEFLAMLAHELRNPLAPLRNATEILQSAETDGQGRDRALQLIRRQINNMSHMLDDLLDVSRITENKIELRREIVELGPVLRAVGEAARSGCEGAGQELQVVLPERAVFVDADSTRLEQIVSNLVGNACKYAGAGTRIVLKAEVMEADDAREVEISVEDDGKGIPADVLPTIFDLFVQGSATLDRGQGGLGIGLTIVHRLVAMHGGSIEAHSEGEGCGATFRVRLPVHEGGGGEEVAGVEETVAGRSLRLLIVDDNVDAAESMALLQQMSGHETRVANSGPEALAMAAEFKPEAVILDIGLPGMNGFEVAENLRRMPGLEKAFLIALTGYGSDNDRLQAEAAGFDEHLVKPADIEELRRILGGGGSGIR